MKRSLLILAVLAFISGAAHAADQAAAQKEGRVVIYSSTDSASAEPLLQDFKSQYPGIVVEYNDLNTTEVYNRFLAEAAGGRGRGVFPRGRAEGPAAPPGAGGNPPAVPPPGAGPPPKRARRENPALRHALGAGDDAL